MDYKSLAKQFGAIEAPQQPSNAGYAPFMADLSPKDQAQLKIDLYKADRKRISDLDLTITKAERIKNMLERYGELNRNSRTGDPWERVLPNWGGFRGDDEKEMIAISSDLGPAKREIGSGSSTDKDVNLYLSGLPGIDKPGNVNKNIRDQYIKQYDYAVEKKTAMEQHLAKYGHLNGFDSEWTARQKAGKGQAGNMPKSKSVQIDGGGSAIATLGADGNYYVKKGGKTYRVEE